MTVTEHGNPLASIHRGDIPGRFNELELLLRERGRVEGMMRGEVLPPFEVLIHPSSSCNLRCVWCIGDHIPIEIWDDSKQPLTLDAAKTAHDILPNTLANPKAMLGLLQGIVDYRAEGADGREYAVEAVSFSGLIGEPLSSKVSVVQGIHFLADHNKRIGMFTNAEMMDQTVRDALLRAAYVNISLDAGKPETYALLKFEGRTSGVKKFSRVIENVTALSTAVHESGSQLTINGSFIIYPETYMELYDAAVTLRSAGVRTLRLKRDISGDRLLTPEQTKEALAQIERVKTELVDDNFSLIEVHHIGKPVDLRRHFEHCRITDLMAAVGSDGNMYPCNYHPRPNGHSYGSVLDGKFQEVWEGSVRASYRKGRLPMDCPKVCDPYKNRANAMLEVASEIYDTDGMENLVAFADALVKRS